jgi:urease accessory protein UreH
MTGTTYDGSLTLEVRGGSWVRTQRPPQSLTVLERPDHLLVIPADQSGGLRGGDSSRTALAVREGGKVEWRPASSSLFFPSADRHGVCRVETMLVVEADCRLDWIPKVAIPCAEAMVAQTTDIHARTGAELLFWDSWADGRTMSGERAAFGSVSSQLGLMIDDRLVFRESWLFRPGRPIAGGDLAGFQGCCQWHLGLAMGARAHRALRERVAAWKSCGDPAECGELAPGVLMARALCKTPRAG